MTYQRALEALYKPRMASCGENAGRSTTTSLNQAYGNTSPIKELRASLLVICLPSSADLSRWYLFKTSKLSGVNLILRSTTFRDDGGNDHRTCSIINTPLYPYWSYLPLIFIEQFLKKVFDTGHAQE
jgi:hypothetical protein